MDTQYIHSVSVESAAEQLATHLQQGLTGAEVQARLEEHGFNELLEKPRPRSMGLAIALKRTMSPRGKARW